MPGITILSKLLSGKLLKSFFMFQNLNLSCNMSNFKSLFQTLLVIRLDVHTLCLSLSPYLGAQVESFDMKTS